jgi:type II secretory pathway component PulM
MSGVRDSAAASSLARWWAGKSRAERRIVTGFALFVALVVGWWALWLPLINDLAALRADAPRSRAALAESHRMADEMAALARTPAAPAAGDPRALLDRSLAAADLRPAVTQLEWQDGRARVVFAAVDFAKLVAGLEALQRESGLAIVEATLTARVEPGTVRAELVLGR